MSDPYLSSSIDKIKDVYNIDRFREQQEEVLVHLLDAGKPYNILYMAPATRGKTLSPLIKALELKKNSNLTLWFVPTIALAHDYEKRIKYDGNYGWVHGVSKLKWLTFTGENAEIKSGIKVDIGYSGADVIVLSPENIKDPAFTAWILSCKNIGQVVIDEAHLLDEWGITFRRSYFLVCWLLRTLRETTAGCKMIALSASLSLEKQKVIRNLLEFTPETTFVSPPQGIHIGPFLTVLNRTDTRNKKDKLIELLNYELYKSNVKKGKPKGILFCAYKGDKFFWSTKTMQREILPHLSLSDEEYGKYDGNTMSEDRKAILEKLHRGIVRLLFATSAFGFGIDIDDMDFSIHIQVPEDIDRFYQEISRCSRNPKTGASYLFYHPQELSVQTRRRAGTLTFDTIKEYLECLGIDPGKTTKKNINFTKVLKKCRKETFRNRHSAQMSADEYFDHALEAVMFLQRHGILSILPLSEKNFKVDVEKLLRAFKDGHKSGFQKVMHKKFPVFFPAITFPVKIARISSWKEIEELVEKDKNARRKRAHGFRVMGKNTSCHWQVIARHYNTYLKDENGKRIEPGEPCNHCNVCLKGSEK